MTRSHTAHNRSHALTTCSTLGAHCGGAEPVQRRDQSIDGIRRRGQHHHAGQVVAEFTCPQSGFHFMAFLPDTRSVAAQKSDRFRLYRCSAVGECGAPAPGASEIPTAVHCKSMRPVLRPRAGCRAKSTDRPSHNGRRRPSSPQHSPKTSDPLDLALQDQKQD